MSTKNTKATGTTTLGKLGAKVKSKTPKTALATVTQTVARQAAAKFELPKYEGIPVLGWIVRWDVRNCNMPHADFCNLLEAHGISKDLALVTLDKNAVIRATKEAAKGKDRFHRKVAEKDAESAFVIASTEVDSANDVTFDQETKVIFDKKTHALVVEGAQKDVIEQGYEKFKTMYTSSQVRTVILRYVKRECKALTVGDLGSLYFIPATNAPEMENLQSLVDAMPGMAELIVLPQPDTSKTRSSMWKVMTDELQSEITRQEKELNSRADVTDKMMETRIQRYQEIKNKVEMYETVLNGTASEMKEQLAKLTDTVRAKLVEE
jgi:hypothetical protein